MDCDVSVDCDVSGRPQLWGVGVGGWWLLITWRYYIVCAVLYELPFFIFSMKLEVAVAVNAVLLRRS